jgi:hypothetical protein
MDAKKPEPKKLSMTSTKQEMLDAYHAVLKQVQEKDATELKPEKVEEKKQREAVQVALALSSDGASREIANLKLEIGKDTHPDFGQTGRRSVQVQENRGSGPVQGEGTGRVLRYREECPVSCCAHRSVERKAAGI